MRVLVQSEPFDPGDALNTFAAGFDGAGALVSFSGIVRNDSGDLDAMEIEHYPGMTERALTQQAHEAVERFALTDVFVIHRFGHLKPGEIIMMVATAAPHRLAAFEAAEFLMDYLKSRAPFWKKEHRAGGTVWIDAKADDEDALKRWAR